MLNNRGFSIIELMIVVAIVGILAAFSIPLYNDYIARSKVSEAIQLSSGTRIPMQEYLGTWGRWPSIATIGGKTKGNYVSNITSGELGNNTYFIETVMKGDAAQKGIYGKQIRLIYYADRKEWACTTATTTSPIPDEYLPTSCK
jgi:type IV pilus assembly protein PilA